MPELTVLQKAQKILATKGEISTALAAKNQTTTDEFDTFDDNILAIPTISADGSVITNGNNYEIVKTDVSSVTNNSVNTSLDVIAEDVGDVLLNDGAGVKMEVPYTGITNAAGITAAKIMSGNTILGVAGTATDTTGQEVAATASDIASGKTAFVNGSKLTGSLATANSVSTDTPTVSVDQSDNLVFDTTISSGTNIVTNNTEVTVTVSDTQSVLTALGAEDSIDVSGPPTVDLDADGYVVYTSTVDTNDKLIVDSETGLSVKANAQTVLTTIGAEDSIDVSGPPTVDLNNDRVIYTTTVDTNDKLVVDGETALSVSASKSAVLNAVGAENSVGTISPTVAIDDNNDVVFVSGIDTESKIVVDDSTYLQVASSQSNVLNAIGAENSLSVVTPTIAESNGYVTFSTTPDVVAKTVVDDATTVDASATEANVASTIGLTANKLVEGNTVLGIQGSAVRSNEEANKTVTPTTSQQIITPTSGQGYTGLAQVTVNAVTSAIDANIAAGNIKAGVSILGVAGTFSADGTATAADIDTGKIAYVNGLRIVGTSTAAADKAALEDTIEALRQELAEITDADDATATMQQIINNLETEIQGLKTSVSTLQGQVTTLTQEKAALQGQLDDVEAVLDQINGEEEEE